jgi:hypothetical protein
MAGAWNEGDWGLGNFGQQNNVTVPVTSVVDTPLAWNVGNFGANNWGGQFNNIGISLGNESVTAEVNEGWGRLAWGENVWGAQATVVDNITGQQINLSLGTLSFKVDAIVQVQSTVITGWGITNWGSGSWGNGEVSTALSISEGYVDPNPDVELTGLQLNLSLNSVSIIGDSLLSLTGQQLNISQGTAQGVPNTIADLTGQQLNVAEGEVDPSPDATVTGIGISVALAIGTVVIGTGNVTLTGEQINISQGTAIGDANTIASITGLRLNTSVGTVFAGGTSIVELTGNGLTIALNSVNNQIWTVINTGTAATWTEIDTAA